MNSFTADPSNPRGRRSGSLVASGTHDEHLVIDGDGAHECDEGDEIAETAQASGAGATELAAFIKARETPEQ
jgi:hypothetical protein